MALPKHPHPTASHREGAPAALTVGAHLSLMTQLGSCLVVNCCPLVFTKAFSLLNTIQLAHYLPSTPSFITFRILRSFFTPEYSQPLRAHSSAHTADPVLSDDGDATAEKEEEVTVVTQSLCCTCHNFAALFVHRVSGDADESFPESGSRCTVRFPGLCSLCPSEYLPCSRLLLFYHGSRWPPISGAVARSSLPAISSTQGSD